MPDDHDLRLIATSPLFDSTWYATRYPDVTISGLTSAEHFLRVGARLGRDPGPRFSTLGYLGCYPELVRAGLNPLSHFERAKQETAGRDRAEAQLPVKTVDVVVPVHNALEDVKVCLNSLARVPTDFGCRVLIVNDGSDGPTSAWLRQAVGSLDTVITSFELIEHDENKGYTVAVNTGLKASQAEYVVTLNSDTIVTPFWLDGLIRCMRSAPDIGITGPLSNAASWQNVPTLYDESGNFVVNALLPGLGPDGMAALVKGVAELRYPRTPFINGFCYMIRRDVIDQIGYMDEEIFPTGYGEENDYSIRAQDVGFALAIADDTFVYHAKSKSFGTKRRIALSKAGSQALKAKHPPERLAALMAAVKDTTAMDEVRARVQAALDEARPPSKRDLRDWAFAQRVLFLLPVSGGSGGAHSVVQEVAAMRRIGVEAKVAVKLEHLDKFRQSYIDIPNAGDLFIGFTLTDLVMIASRFDVVVATISTSVKLLSNIVEHCPWVLPAYYVQDYEPNFFAPGSDHEREAYESYTLIGGAILFAKTDWLCRQVEERHGIAVHKVEPSIDHEVYKPRISHHHTDDRVCIVAMVRPRTPRRGAGRTMEILKRLKRAYAERVRIRIFGCSDDDSEFLNLPRDFAFENNGVLTRPEVAALLQETDVFIDMSDYQAFGRTALEAMACGALSLVPALGGADEYAVDGVNAIVVDTQDIGASFAKLTEILSDPDRMAAMRLAALSAAARYSPRRAALSEMIVLAPPLTKLRETVPRPQRPRLMLLPALATDRGGNPSITGSGYVRLVQPYIQDALASRFDVTVSMDGSLPHPASADLVLLQSDLAEDVRPEFERWHQKFRGAGGRMIYDLDDDLLDVEVLAAKGYPGRPRELVKQILIYARLADLITVPTSHLASRFADSAEKVHIVPNAIDERLWMQPGQVIRNAKDVRPKGEGQVRIGYMGTPSHYEDMRLVGDAMRQLQDHFGEAVDIELVGTSQDQALLFGTCLGLPRRRAYPDVVRWIQRIADWDITIIPLAENQSNLAGSDLKFVEAATLGTAIVCSDVPTYRELAQHGENCLLVPNTTEAWISALKSLIEDPALRRRLADAARRDVASQMTVQKRSSLYLSVLDAALEATR